MTSIVFAVPQATAELAQRAGADAWAEKAEGFAKLEPPAGMNPELAKRLTAGMEIVTRVAFEQGFKQGTTWLRRWQQERIEQAGPDALKALVDTLNAGVAEA